MGNAQVLGNGNVVVGWGSEPFVTEFAPDGAIVFDAKLPPGGQNYRAFRFPWVGRRSRRPRSWHARARRPHTSTRAGTAPPRSHELARGPAPREPFV